MSRKRHQGIDADNIDDFELRVSDLETKMSFFSKMFVPEKDNKAPMRLQLETRT